MRLVKAQNTNLRNVKGKGIRYTIDEEVIIDSNNVVLVAKGTTAERPANAENGHLRYNTSTNDFEAFSNGAWRTLRYEEPFPQGIIQDNLGNGDAVQVYFGPLSVIPAGQAHILVIVENVFQISGTNYLLTQNPAGESPGWYVEFTSPPDAGKPVTVIHNFDK